MLPILPRSVQPILGVVLSAALVAQGDPVPATAPALSSVSLQDGSTPYPPLAERLGGTWVAQWNRATKTPSAIYGSGAVLADWRENTIEEGRRHADKLLQDQADLLRLGSSEFREIIGARMGRSWCFVYEQYFRGLRAIGGRADVRINMRGVLASIGSTAWQIPADFDVVPAIGETLAEAKAWLALGQEPTGVPQPAVRKSRLVIWGDAQSDQAESFYLAWEIPISNVDRNGNGPVGRYYIDAKTGEMLRYETDKHDCGFNCAHESHSDPAAERAPGRVAYRPEGELVGLPPVPTTVTVMAWTRTGLSAVSPLVNTPMPNLLVSVSGLGTVTTDQNGQFTIDIAAPVTASVATMDGTHCRPIAGTTPPNASVTVNPGVNTTLQILTNAATQDEAAHPDCYYWVDEANEWLRGILGNTTQMAGADNVLPTVNLVSINPQTGAQNFCNAYYTGNTINFYPLGGGCNNTAFSTVVVHEWGHGIDDRYGGITNNSAQFGMSEGWGDIFGMFLANDPITGLGFFTNGSSIRTGLNTTMFGVSTTDPHRSGEVWMGFAWRLRVNLVAAFPSTGIGISNDIVLTTIAANANDHTTAVREVFIADDDNGNLLDGVPHYAQLSAAAIAKGIPYPQIQVLTISHTPLANTTVRLTPRRVLATVAPTGAGSVTQVRLVYNAGAGSQTRTMIPSGALNGFHALLPGVSGGAVTYHIEAVHSSGTVVRVPETTEISYTVSAPSNFSAFYTENFNSGGAGWTHGRLSATGTEDWQIGNPAGRTGTSLGVAWSDPSAAVTGSAIYGTDLGAATNGAYPNNISYFLRSPIINCSGRTDVVLRFRRWLTVEEGQFDQAQVLVNGQQVYVNQSIGHTIDTAWQTVEYAVPIANNNPSVQLEWRLTADQALALGGWNIDDVQLGSSPAVPLPAELRVLPEQAASGAPMTMTFDSTVPGPLPALWVLGDTSGPTVFPGVPPILVGGGLINLFAFTDGVGHFALPFVAPQTTAASGQLIFSQVLTLDAGSNIIASNQWLNLFTP